MQEHRFAFVASHFCPSNRSFTCPDTGRKTAKHKAGDLTVDNPHFRDFDAQPKPHTHSLQVGTDHAPRCDLGTARRAVVGRLFFVPNSVIALGHDIRGRIQLATVGIEDRRDKSLQRFPWGQGTLLAMPLKDRPPTDSFSMSSTV